MNGAREYAGLFTTGQYERFYIVSGEHARGKTFHIFILPAGEEAIPNGPNNACLNDDAVEVYGITGGNPGWTETYGWLHKGKWQHDFELLANSERMEKAGRERIATCETLESVEAKRGKIKRLLSAYEQEVQP